MKGSAKLSEQSKSPPVLFSNVTPGAPAGRSIFEIHLAPMSISVVPVVAVSYIV